MREAVASASRQPQEAFLWVREVEQCSDIARLEDSDGFHTLDSKLASALARIVTGTLGRSIDVERESTLK